MADLLDRSNDVFYVVETAFWRAVLSNGEVVTDDRDAGASVWQLLKEKCERENLHVVQLSLHFRDRQITLPTDKAGYFVRHALKAGIAGDQTNYVLLGYVDLSQVYIDKYSVPDLTYETSEVRSIQSCENSIIWRVDG